MKNQKKKVIKKIIPLKMGSSWFKVFLADYYNNVYVLGVYQKKSILGTFPTVYNDEVTYYTQYPPSVQVNREKRYYKKIFDEIINK